jgi:hypothetical protein
MVAICWRTVIAADGKKADRQAGDPEFVHRRRKNTRRQETDNAIRQARQLGLRGINAVFRLKKYFDVTDAGQRLGFDVLDVTGLYEALLHAQCYRPFHFRRAEAAIERCDQNRRNADLGEDIDAHLLIRDDPEYQRDHAEREDGVGVLEAGAGQHLVSTI